MAQKEKIFRGPFGQCPICGQFMSVEMLPIGLSKKDEKGKQKIEALFSEALNQTIRWTGEMLARIVASACTAEAANNIVSSRHLYFTCNNKECPAHYTNREPKYFEKNAFGMFDLKGDAVGFRTDLYKAQYRAAKMRREAQRRMKLKFA